VKKPRAKKATPAEPAEGEASANGTAEPVAAEAPVPAAPVKKMRKKASEEVSS
jgi:hypothetical protein